MSVMPRASALAPAMIQDQMAAMQRKIELLEWDHMAYQDSSSLTIQANNDTIKLLQQEKQKLTEEIAQHRHAETEAKGGQRTVQLKEGQLQDSAKHLNALTYQAQVRTKRLEELESLLKQNAAMKKKKNTTQEEQNQHLLENKHEETQLRLQDAEYINSVYKKIIALLQEELTTLPAQTQSLEAEILLLSSELKDVKAMNQNALEARNTVWAVYKNLEKDYVSERSKKGEILRDLRKQVKELKRHEKEQAKRQDFIGGKALIDDAHEVSAALAEEDRIRGYEDALQKIKDATGTMNKHEVLQRFITQRDTRKYLEKEKLQAEKTLSELKEKQKHMDNALQELKYTGEAMRQAKLSNHLKILKGHQSQLQLQTKEKAKYSKEAAKARNLLKDATSEIQLLEVKLRNIQLPGMNLTPAKDLAPDLHALDILAIIGQKMETLQKQVEEKDTEQILREMLEEKFVDNLTRNRISLLPCAKQDLTNVEDSSDEDCEVLSRQDLKKLSQQIVKSNSSNKKQGK